MMNRKIGRRTGIVLGVLLGVAALSLTAFAFKVSMDASRALSDRIAVARLGADCR